MLEKDLEILVFTTAAHMMVKSGYRTSEFWFTLVSFLFSGLYLAGILKENDQKEQLIEIVSHAVESVILIGGQIIILSKYIKGRTEIKRLAANPETTINDDQRANNTKSRKNKPRAKTRSTKCKKNSSK